MADISQFAIASQRSDIRFHYGLSVFVLRMGGTQGNRLMGRTQGDRGVGGRLNGVGYESGSEKAVKAMMVVAGMASLPGKGVLRAMMKDSRADLQAPA